MSNYYIAGIYDFILYPFLNKLRQQTTKVIIQLQPKSMIDICCGTGNQLKYLKDTGIQLTGVDNSPYMLKVAKNLNCYNQDARTTQFNDATFDLALIQLALHEKSFDDQKKIIHESYRLLKPNGHLVVVDYEIGNQTRKSAKRLIHFVEFLAGKEHYKFFKAYHQNGCLQNVINPELLTLKKNISLAGKSMTMKIYQKQ